MRQTDVPRDRLDLREDDALLSPPWLATPYRCATAVTVLGVVADAEVDVEVDGTIVVVELIAFPDPLGTPITLPAPLAADQVVRVRQRTASAESAWSVGVTTREHTRDFPAGPPRPRIDPAPVFRCGSRTGVANLLAGGTVWITADGGQVGRVEGCSPHQGVNVSPDYGLGQDVRAWFELCGDPSPPSPGLITQPPPVPLPAPGFEPIYEGGRELIVTNVVNGARVTLVRGGAAQGTWRCWGGRLRLGLAAPFAAGETLSATQRMCPGEAPSPAGTGTVEPCSSLPAPRIGPLQANDDRVIVVQAAPGATIKVFVNGAQRGAGAAPAVAFAPPVRLGDTVHVVQDLDGCRGASALEVRVPCVDPPVDSDPSALDLFPVGVRSYDDGAVRGTIAHPADDDGTDQPFNARLAGTGRAPLVVMAHGNHDPAVPSHLGYDYLQAALARMGIVAVSVDCNALNGFGGGVANIEDRADLVIDTIRFLRAHDADPAWPLAGRIDFGRIGLMGHSRGGDAVVTIPTVLALPGVRVRGVHALAPTNFRFWFGLPTIRPTGLAFMTILPAGDGDVVENNGAQFYDQAEPAPFRSQLYVHHANHNFFNRRWLVDESLGPPVMSRADHERILTAYGCAFFRAVCLGHATTGFLAGTRRPAGVPSDQVHLSFESGGQVTVDHHEDGNTIAVNSLGLPTAQSGGMSADEFTFGQGPGAFNGTFYGESVGMVARPGPPTRTLRSEIRSRNLRRREVWVRVAEVVGQRIPRGATGFELGLEDTSGRIAWLDADAVGGVPRPYPHPTAVKTMLTTLRFKADCFAGLAPRLDLGRVRAIHIRCNRADERALAFDDLQIVRP